MTDTTRILNVAIVGLGHLHPRSYMPLFDAEPRMKVTCVMEDDAELRNAFAKDFNITGYDTLETMLANEKLDIAAIFLPHADCPAAAAACAKGRLHLMIEKPMAADAKGAEAICDAAEANNVKITTGYCWRTHPVAKEFKRLLKSGIVGRIVGAEGRCAAGKLHRYIQGHSPWMLQRERSGGGPMYNLGVHWIDLFRWMFEDDVTEVSGQNVKINTEYDIEDNSFAHMRFANGTIASLDISYTVPDSFPHGRDLYLAVRGTTGAISWAPAYEGANDVLNVCSDHPDFVASPRRSLSFELQPTAGYSGIMGQNYVGNFADAILNDAPLAITGRDGVAALKVVEAIYTSANEKRWIEVSK